MRLLCTLLLFGIPLGHACTAYDKNYIARFNELTSQSLSRNEWRTLQGEQPSNLSSRRFVRDYKKWHQKFEQQVLEESTKMLDVRGVLFKVYEYYDKDCRSLFETNRQAAESKDKALRAAFKNGREMLALVELDIVAIGQKALQNIGYLDAQNGRWNQATRKALSHFTNADTPVARLHAAHTISQTIDGCNAQGCDVTTPLLRALAPHWAVLRVKQPQLLHTISTQACTKVEATFANAKTEKEVRTYDVTALIIACENLPATHDNVVTVGPQLKAKISALKTRLQQEELEKTAAAAKAKAAAEAATKKAAPETAKDLPKTPRTLPWPPAGTLRMVIPATEIAVDVVFTNDGNLYEANNKLFQASGRLKQKLSMVGEFAGATVFVTILPDHTVFIRPEAGGLISASLELLPAHAGEAQ